MDIFTTVLTRVVPNPIKPADLKVKALLKDAPVGKLKEDLDHLENHKYYFDKKDLKKGSSELKENEKENKKEEKLAEDKVDLTTEIETDEHDDTNEEVTESKDGTKHLDLYV